MPLDTTLTSTPTQRRLPLAIALVAAASLALVGCTAPAAPPPSSDGSTATLSGDEGEVDAVEGGDSYDPAMPDDFPQDIFVPDGQMVSGSGSAGKWVVVKTIHEVDQARVAVDSNVKSYGFTIDDFVDDGEYSSWSISNDKYDVLVDLRPGDPIVVTYVVEER